MVEEEKLIEVSGSRPNILSDRMSTELIGVVYRAVGLASMCWSNIDGAGTFDAKEAEDIAVELCYTIADEIEAERDAVCGYIETITKREHGSILRLPEVELRLSEVELKAKKGFGMHQVFPVENIQFCCDALKDATIMKDTFVFAYKSMEEDERDYTCKWHVTCPFCQTALTISQDGIEIDKMDIQKRLTDEYKELLEFEIECVGIKEDLGHALERIEEHLNAVNITDITVSGVKED